MPRPSPQTDRVVATINLLAATESGLTLSEIGRALSVHVSSCVHLLAALTAAGYVVRDPDDRRYHLGPALVRPGAVAQRLHPDLAAARPHMAALSEELGLACLAFRREGTQARLVQHTWPPGSGPPPIRLGDTVPLVPPLGATFLAWAGDDEVAAWLAADPTLTSEQATRCRQDLAAVARAGYAVELEPSSVAPEDLAVVVDDRPSPFRDRRLRVLLVGGDAEGRVLTAADAASDYRVHGISAPVFEAGTVTMGLYVIGFDRPLSATGIDAVGAAVRRAADRTSTALST